MSGWEATPPPPVALYALNVVPWNKAFYSGQVVFFYFCERNVDLQPLSVTQPLSDTPQPLSGSLTLPLVALLLFNCCLLRRWLPFKYDHYVLR